MIDHMWEACQHLSVDSLEHALFDLSVMGNDIAMPWNIRKFGIDEIRRHK